MSLEEILECMFGVLAPEPGPKGAEPYVGEEVRVLQAALIW